MNNSGAVVRLLRPREWVKNVFVLAPTIFAARFHDPIASRNALIAFALFSAAASAAYILNDLLDADKDRLHPVKRLSKPIAAGEISRPTAMWLLGAMYAIVAVGAFVLPAAAPAIVLYLAINAAYSLRLKDVVVVDIFLIAAGFVLRVYAGARAIDVPLSHWMLITTLALALYLASVKRLQELRGSGSAARAVLGSYSAPLLERYAEAAAISALVFYSLFVVTERPALTISVPIVMFGMFRYWYIVETLAGGESPTDALWADTTLKLTVVAWAGVCMWAYWPK